MQLFFTAIYKLNSGFLNKEMLILRVKMLHKENLHSNKQYSQAFYLVIPRTSVDKTTLQAKIRFAMPVIRYLFIIVVLIIIIT